MSLSKNKLKFIRSLELKKKRKEEGCFLAEGPKLIEELLPHFECITLVATTQWLGEQRHLPAAEVIEVSAEELGRVSLLKSPQQVLAVLKQPAYAIDYAEVENSLTLVLDDIQDPGNLGTIIRLADWFGIKNIVCSPGSADVYNPKVVQATMGGLARVRVHYVSLTSFLGSLSGRLPVYGTFLNGDNIYTEKLSVTGVIVMGNEGSGISSEIEKMISKRLYIPNYPQNKETSESLNVAIATAITCAEFRRQPMYS